MRQSPGSAQTKFYGFFDSNDLHTIWILINYFYMGCLIGRIEIILRKISKGLLCTLFWRVQFLCFLAGSKQFYYKFLWFSNPIGWGPKLFYVSQCSAQSVISLPDWRAHTPNDIYSRPAASIISIMQCVSAPFWLGNGNGQSPCTWPCTSLSLDAEFQPYSSLLPWSIHVASYTSKAT